jgi:carbamoyl-phosphate synthase large subunit
MMEICQREQVDLLIPLYEPEFLLLDGIRQQLERKGTILMLSRRETLEICLDKYKTYLFCREHGFPVPKTAVYPGSGCHGQPVQQLSMDYPVFLKPRWGRGGQHAYRVNDREELEFYSRKVPDAIIQENVEGTEYTIDVLCDLEGNVLAAVPRIRLEVRAGEVSKSKTVKDREVIQITCRLLERLRAAGPMTVQGFKTRSGALLFTEINPRFGGGVPLTFAAGVNYALLIHDMLAGHPIERSVDDFREMLMLRYDQAFYQCVDGECGGLEHGGGHLRP